MISSVGGITDVLAQKATSMQSANIATQIGVAVLKQIMDRQKTNGDAMVQLIQQTTAQQLAATGHIDIRA